MKDTKEIEEVVKMSMSYYKVRKSSLLYNIKEREQNKLKVLDSMYEEVKYIDKQIASLVEQYPEFFI